MDLRDGQLEHPAVVALLREHFAGMLAASPPGTCHFLDLAALAAPEVTFVTAWEGETLLGCGALKALGDGHGELKSMRTAAAALRRGVAAAILTHLIDRARAAGITRLSLETGTGPAFAAAEALYLRHGFTPCGPFADYEATEFNRYMTRAL
ncbi:GNAT family N-acetyltransferase [Sphingomonas spermidinifaciens]|uniref:GNAT family N-acetyltransferase n=1 Tax=Sphingomonas spermidinifaciens TaxID=1141889 RepID=A0A2A4B8L6_9SPHN|nr:GNAT family N-acetyltransferase [Sphingomonas spermidinifaciens]PCD04265.1 GNAT family N-acetyltransferase [Sphingomonas spermidinifaciens]